MKKLRVGVLMGGKSLEREVSFNSGRTVCDHLDTCHYTVIPLFQRKDGVLFILPFHFLHRGKISDFEYRLDQEASKISWQDLKATIDFLYIALHGRFGEDGTIQGMLELLAIPYLGSKVLASALGMDKNMQKKMLRAHGIATPRSITILPHELAQHALTLKFLTERMAQQALSLPCIIKPSHEGSSLGVTVGTTLEELVNQVYKAAYINPEKVQPVLIEEKIDGMEFSCICIIDRLTGQWIALPPTEIVHEKGTHVYDYEQKYMPGRAHKYTPARCSAKVIEQIQATCIATSRALNFATVSRIDGIVTPDSRIMIIDPNSLSGMAPSSYLFNQAAELGMSHTDIINYLIQTELDQYGIQRETQTNDTSMNSVHNERIRVAVLLGGDTGEREISLESGRNVIYKLSPQRYQAIALFVDDSMNLYRLTQAQLVRGSTQEIKEIVSAEARITWEDLPAIADFVFIALHGGKGENGSVQGALELLGIPYNGSGVLASALCMDKYRTTQFLNQHGFDVAPSLLIQKINWQEDQERIIAYIQNSIEFPCILKPHDDGCSIMVTKIASSCELKNSLDEFFLAGRTTAMIEAFIEGMELTVGVIGNDTPCALPPSRAVAIEGVLSIEEKFLPGAGENLTPAPLPAEDLRYVQDVVKKVYEAVNCAGYARIDCFFQPADISPTGSRRVIILEINTLPGLTPATCIFHQAAEIGMRPMDFIDRIITLGIELHRPSLPGSINYCQITPSSL